MTMSYILHDCDTGSDDAIALMMLLSCRDKVNPVAVTCVGGNTPLDNVVMNNLRILKLFDALESVPIYKGCAEPLVPASLPDHPTAVHGSDGMGGVPDQYPAASPELLKHLQPEHAVNAIIRLSKEYAGKLKIVITGPLTNLAMAVKLDPELPSRLEGIYIMGGTRAAKGNVTSIAEFNFFYDPEAAWITLRQFSPLCSVHMIDYELTIENPTPWEWADAWLDKQVGPKHLFARAVLQPIFKFSRGKRRYGDGLVICDAYAMAMAIDSEVGIKPSEERVVVELGGFHSRGLLAIDHFGKETKCFGPVLFYEGINLDLYHTMIENALREA